MKRLITLLAVLTISVSALYSNGLSLNSIGTRALGMGGAFVGLADDATAIYWNPAGLANIEGSYIGIFATDVVPMAKYENKLANISAETKTNHYISPNIFAYWNCMLYDKLKISLSAYVPAGLGAEFNGDDLKLLSNNKAYNWSSKIAVFNISPAVSYKILPNLSVGAALNIYYGMFDLERPSVQQLSPTMEIDGQYDESSTGVGYGATFGILYSPIKELSIGATLRTKTKVDMSGTANNTMMPKIPTMSLSGSSDFDREVSWPLWFAMGIAVRPMNNIVLTLDAQYSQWSESCKEFDTKFEDAGWVAVTTPTQSNKFILKWEDAVQIRFGAEYNANEDLTLRLGAYNDPAPAPDETYNILFPDMTYNAFTLGASNKFGKFTVDLGLEYLIGKEREITQSEHNMGGTHNCNIFAVSFGLGYSF